MNTEKMNGVGLIVVERDRQITGEGWTAEHDDTHDKGEMAYAAAAYLQANTMLQYVREGYGITQIEHHLRQMYWPATWDKKWLKVSPDPQINLVKAGALIAAEIDRLQRKSPTPVSSDAGN